MKPRVRDTLDAIRDWIKKKITDGPSHLYDLGKHLFTVSIGSIALLVTVARIVVPIDFHLPGAAYIVGVFFVFAALLSLYLTLPRALRLA